ncbi:MAG: hypothetical protein ACRDKT_02790 [Actinomycetota bacterium]
MTDQKARKRAIRARMAKTGERYTAARANVVKNKKPSYDASLLPQSEETMRRATGNGWDHWIATLDRWGGTEHTHTEIARYVNQQLGVSGWWSQTVTVGYERVRGMRSPNQRSDGFSVDVSKTVSADVDTVYEAVTNARRRGRWLETGTLKTRTSRPGKSARFDFVEDGSRVHISFTAKGPSKATLTVQHERLAAKKDVEKMRAFWKERLARLAEQLRS